MKPRPQISRALLFGLLLLPWICTSCADTEAPVVRLDGRDSITVDRGVPYVDPGYIAFDKNDLDIADQVVVTGEVVDSLAGYYDLTYTATDKAGNSAQTSRVVRVAHTLTSTGGRYYYGYTTFGGCPTGSRSLAYIDPYEPGDILFTPALGTVSGNSSYLRALFVGPDAPQLQVRYGHLPCGYAIVGGSGIVSDNGLVITFSLHLTADSNGASYYTTIYYIQ